MSAQGDTCLRSLGSGVRAAGAAERATCAAPQLEAEWSFSFFFPLEVLPRNSHVKLRLTQTETDEQRDRDRHRDTLFRKLAGYKRAVSKAAGRDGGRPLQEVALARDTAATVLSATGNGAFRGRVVRTSFVFTVAPFGTEPLLVNTESKTDTHRDRQTQTQTDRHRIGKVPSAPHEHKPLGVTGRLREDQ